MRLLIITGIFPPDIGGPATYVPQIAKALVERGHHIIVITLSDHPNPNTQYPFQVVRLRRRMWKPWRWFLTILSLIRLGRNADVLFVNGLAMEAVLANILLRKPLVVKVVGDLAWERATMRGWTGDNFETFQQKRYGLQIELLKVLRSWWTRQAHRVIVPSQYLANWVARWGVPEERIKVIYNAVEPMDGVAPVLIPFSAGFKAITVGRLIPWKRVDQVLEVVAQLPGLGLVIVGDGPECPYLERLARLLEVTGRVYFAGRCNHKETLALMAACDIFVLNSTYEGLPHIVLEAMALGLPVVATAVGGTPEVVKDGENRMLIPARDGSLKEVLQQLMENPELRQRLGETARRWVGECFAIDRMVKQTEAILSNVARKGSGR